MEMNKNINVETLLRKGDFFSKIFFDNATRINQENQSSQNLTDLDEHHDKHKIQIVVDLKKIKKVLVATNIYIANPVVIETDNYPETIDEKSRFKRGLTNYLYGNTEIVEKINLQKLIQNNLIKFGDDIWFLTETGYFSEKRRPYEFHYRPFIVFEKNAIVSDFKKTLTQEPVTFCEPTLEEWKHNLKEHLNENEFAVNLDSQILRLFNEENELKIHRPAFTSPIHLRNLPNNYNLIKKVIVDDNFNCIKDSAKLLETYYGFPKYVNETNIKKEIDEKIKSFSEPQLKYWKKRAKKKNTTIEKLVREKILYLKGFTNTDNN